jgi:hypothetical protein
MPARNVMFVVIAVAGGRVEPFIAFFSIEGDDLFERMCRFHCIGVRISLTRCGAVFGLAQAVLTEGAGDLIRRSGELQASPTR